MYPRTKIVVTVGPACETESMLRTLIESGANVFRLNFSHGDQTGKVEIIERIRNVSRSCRKTVAILGDLQGPKIRAGLMQNDALPLTVGHEVTITTRDVLGAGDLIPTTYRALPEDVSPGDQVLLDDGLIELEVIRVASEDILCLVKVGGVLKNRKGINLPGVDVSAPSLTEKDISDLQFCVRAGIDYIGLSFVRTAADVLRVKELLAQEKSAIRVIAKIEKPEAVTDFDNILNVADGIMVARGDLGVEISPERVPLIQKQIIRKCNAAGKPVITATQMLESMVHNPRPTRAETSDVANAIIDGSDAIMLSAETATGKYPQEAVSLMVRVANDVEADVSLKKDAAVPSSPINHHLSLPEAIGQAACRVAEALGAAAILAFTQTGQTAALVAKYRPRLPIFAVTPSPIVLRQLSLYAGVYPHRVDIEGDTEAQIRAVEATILATGLLQRGDVVIITMGSPVSGPGTTNLLKAHRLGTGEFYEIH